ncbi:hypothetical protein N4G62_14035 [Sphingomonas sanguinis]|uniref:Uncharacterized protein n=1 Tax=Sphingomonas sanguinis TaxID=33051 RepID=A0ABU5LT80_9SPHN|nr:hypothetical protein [Sphingomonas sanguinis]
MTKAAELDIRNALRLQPIIATPPHYGIIIQNMGIIPERQSDTYGSASWRNPNGSDGAGKLKTQTRHRAFSDYLSCTAVDGELGTIEWRRHDSRPERQPTQQRLTAQRHALLRFHRSTR